MNAIQNLADTDEFDEYETLQVDPKTRSLINFNSVDAEEIVSEKSGRKLRERKFLHSISEQKP